MDIKKYKKKDIVTAVFEGEEPVDYEDYKNGEYYCISDLSELMNKLEEEYS